MDVLHFIKGFHDEVKFALAALEASEGVKDRRVKADDLSRLAQTYLDLEKSYLYPEIQDLFPGVDTLIKVGEANGAAISRRLKNLQKLVAKPAAEQDGYDKRLEELKISLLEHFASEEQVLMPKMRMMIRTEDREELGQVFLDARDELTRGTLVTEQTSSRKRA